MDPSRFRAVVKTVSGKEISTEQAASFLDIFGGDLEDVINQAIRGFIAKHFGTKNGTNSTGPGA